MTRKEPLRLLSENDVKSVGLSLHEVLNLTEYAYLLDASGLAEVPTKIGVHPDYPGSFLHAMPAWVDEARALGMKWVSYFPGNFDRDLPDSTGIIILNHPDTGQPVCIMEGMHVTFLRTAACAAVAVRNLMIEPPQTLTLVGCGGLGKWSLRMMTVAFPSITRIFVSSRTPASRERFCAEMQAEGSGSPAITPVDDLVSAAQQSDVIITSIPPGEAQPVSPACLKPGSFFVPLDLMNSWQDDVLQATNRIVADNPQNLADLLAKARPDANGAVGKIARLQEAVAGRADKSARRDRTFVGVCGIASTDVVIGWEIYRRAVRAGIGTSFGMT